MPSCSLFLLLFLFAAAYGIFLTMVLWGCRGTQFVQKGCKGLETRRGHVAELGLMKLMDGLVERFQDGQRLRSDARNHHAAIAGMAFTGDQSMLLHAVEKPGHV